MIQNLSSQTTGIKKLQERGGGDGHHCCVQDNLWLPYVKAFCKLQDTTCTYCLHVLSPLHLFSGLKDFIRNPWNLLSVSGETIANNLVMNHNEQDGEVNASRNKQNFQNQKPLRNFWTVTQLSHGQRPMVCIWNSPTWRVNRGLASPILFAHGLSGNWA